jgi:hypothetical protein
MAAEECEEVPLLDRHANGQAKQTLVTLWVFVSTA